VQGAIVFWIESGQFEQATNQVKLLNAYLSIASCFWSWWRSLPNEHMLSTKFPYLKARKHVHTTDQWVNLAPAAGCHCRAQWT